MRTVFMGTPELAVPTLEALLEQGHEVAAVMTQPDRPAGAAAGYDHRRLRARRSSSGYPSSNPPASRPRRFSSGSGNSVLK